MIGFGIFFSTLSWVAIQMYLKYTGRSLTSELYSTAGRNMGIGPVACAVVSSWTWSATILQSSNVTYMYGFSGALWYAAGATIQLFLFGVLSIHLKSKASNAHTVGEIVYARWGPFTHKVFVYFLLLTNVFILAMLVGGGSVVFETITGLDRGTCSFFIRLFFYSGSGGLVSIYASSYLHVAISFVIMLIFVWDVHMFADDLGSPSEMFDRLQAIQHQTDQDCIDFGYDPDEQTCGRVDSNKDGSYLTMESLDGFYFGLINIIGNFGAVFVDQSYWTIAISADRHTVFPGFILGGMLWFAVPLCMSNSLGLANVALQLPTNHDEAKVGLVAVASALHLRGRLGCLLLMIQLFMAVSAAGSSQLHSICLVLIYDVYRRYLDPGASSRDVKYTMRLVCVSLGGMLGALSICVQGIGLSLGWMYLLMGILIGSGVFPLCCLLTWRKATAQAAVSAAIGGQLLAVTTWLLSSHLMFGEITLDSTGRDDVMLIGNITALSSSVLIMVIVTLWQPEDFDFDTLNDKLTLIISTTEKAKMQEKQRLLAAETRSEDAVEGAHTDSCDGHAPEDGRGSGTLNPIAGVAAPASSGSCQDGTEGADGVELTEVKSVSDSPDEGSDNQKCEHPDQPWWAIRFSEIQIAVGLSVLLVVVWPALTLPAGVFSKGYFTFWIALTVVLATVATLVIIVFPVYELYIRAFSD